MSDESFVDLEEKLCLAKQSLIILNENIRRFVGRGPKSLRREKANQDVDGTKKTEPHNRQIHYYEPNGPKRRLYESKAAMERNPSGGNEEFRPRINSRVIRELPSREEVVEAQGADLESRARNRRMFGSLLGTLQKFCQEESRLKKNEEKKARIEKKLEKQELQERAMLKRERELLFSDRKRKQIEIKRLEFKMARYKDFKAWETSIFFQKHHILTKTKPHLYFRPRMNSMITEALLLKSNNEINVIVERRREELQAELRDLESINIADEDTLDESMDEPQANTDSGRNVEAEISSKCDKNTKENQIKRLSGHSLNCSMMIF